MGKPKPRTFGTVLLWSDDPKADFLEARTKYDALNTELEREERDLRERLYKWLDLPREYWGAWVHDPRPLKTKDPFPLSKRDATIAARALSKSIKLAKDSKRPHERDTRIVRALLSQDSNSAKIQAICEDMGIVRSHRSSAPIATDLYLQLTNGSKGLRVAYELPPGCVGLSQVRQRVLPHETPLSKEAAAEVLADWFEVKYETIRTWLDRERARRDSPPEIKLPLSPELRIGK